MSKKPPPAPEEVLMHSLCAQPLLGFAVLVGSRATGTAHAGSDWDIALQWSPRLDWLATMGRTETTDLSAWNAIIGLRNRILHDYMNIDMDQVLALVTADKYQFVAHFLCREFSGLEDRG